MGDVLNVGDRVRSAKGSPFCKHFGHKGTIVGTKRYESKDAFVVKWDVHVNETIEKPEWLVEVG